VLLQLLLLLLAVVVAQILLPGLCWLLQRWLD
jgi:hypothetical protein